jgi:phosphoglycolate phosphatase-like HAD superfamily hydrolase
MIRYIFFDFDGTISDARKLTYDTMLDVLTKRGYKFSELKLRKLMGAKTASILGGLGIDRRETKKVKREFFKEVVKRTSKKSIRLCAPIESLRKMKKKGIKLIVVSNSEKPFLEASMGVLKISGLFDEVYGSSIFKSKDKLLKKLFKRYNIQSNEALYVGDRFSDIDYAHRAHCYAVAIHNKCAWSTKKEILAEKPDYIVSNFRELKELVDGLN